MCHSGAVVANDDALQAKRTALKFDVDTHRVSVEGIPNALRQRHQRRRTRLFGEEVRLSLDQENFAAAHQALPYDGTLP